MKSFNGMCLTTLLVCGAYCTSHLHAESSEVTEHHNEIIEHDLSTDATERTTQEMEPSNSRDIVDDTANAIDGIYISVGENAANNAVEVATEVSISNQTIDNTITSVETTVTQETPAAEADLDAMVEELVQSGAVENDISTLTSQPQWKLILASIGSYALSLGISCQQLLVNIFTSLQTMLTSNSAAKKTSKKI